MAHAAINALRAVDDLKALPRSLSKAVTKAIADSSFDPAASVELIYLAQDIGPADPVPALLSRLVQATESQLKLTILEVLGGFEAAVSQLPSPLPYLDDADRNVRSAAAELAGSLHLAAEVPRLVALARNERMPEAIIALARIATPDALTAVFGILNGAHDVPFDPYPFGYGLATVGTAEARRMMSDRFKRATDEERRDLTWGVADALQLGVWPIDYREPITDAVLAELAQRLGVARDDVRSAFTKLAEYLPLQLAFSS